MTSCGRRYARQSHGHHRWHHGIQKHALAVTVIVVSSIPGGQDTHAPGDGTRSTERVPEVDGSLIKQKFYIGLLSHQSNSRRLLCMESILRGTPQALRA